MISRIVRFAIISISFAGALATVAPLDVLAQSPPASSDTDQQELEKLLEEAKIAREQSRYEDALRLLLEAYTIYPAPALLFNIAMVYQDQGQCENALSFVARAHANAVRDEKASGDLQAGVRRAITRFECGDDLQRTVAALKAHEKTFPIATNLRIANLHRERKECELARDAYMTVIEKGGDDELVKVARDELASFECAEESTTPATNGDGGGTEEQRDESDGAGWRYTGYGLTGVGVVTLAIAVVVDLDTASTFDELDDVGKAGREKARYDELAKDAEDGQNLALMLYIGSGVLVAAGVGAWLYGRSLASSDSKTAGLQVTPWLGREEVGLGVSGPLPFADSW